MKKILIIITLALLVLSCNKEKTCSSLTLGDYYGKFTFNSDGIIKTDSSIEISQITDNSIIIKAK